MSHARKEDYDPGWQYPYATRARIAFVERYVAELEYRKRNYKPFTTRGRDSHVLKGMPGVDSVPPHLRADADAWFNRRIEIERAKGIPGWPSPGKIRSLRMLRAKFARDLLSGNSAKRIVFRRAVLKEWNRYLAWLAQQDRQMILRNLPPIAPKVLEIA